MKKFKKIYIEITNICNLSCSFCSVDNKLKETITLEKLEKLLENINEYTDYVYLHVKGEPLLHPELNQILDLCQKYNKKLVNNVKRNLTKHKVNAFCSFRD